MFRTGPAKVVSEINRSAGVVEYAHKCSRDRYLRLHSLSNCRTLSGSSISCNLFRVGS